MVPARQVQVLLLHKRRFSILVLPVRTEQLLLGQERLGLVLQIIIGFLTDVSRNHMDAEGNIVGRLIWRLMHTCGEVTPSFG